MNKDKVQNIIQILNSEFPKPKAPLTHQSAYELLVAVILSAQCTDKRVNIVTPRLFKEANTPQQMLKLGLDKLKQHVRSCGFYNAKAANIIEMSAQLIEKLDGEVPSDFKDLVALPGVGPKTAQVVQCQWFNIPGFPVDTHIQRVSNRIGLAKTKKHQVDKTEKQLKKRIPKENWIDMHLQIIFHGRKTCTAYKPKCYECPIQDQCEYKSKNLNID